MCDWLASWQIPTVLIEHFVFFVVTQREKPPTIERREAFLFSSILDRSIITATIINYYFYTLPSAPSSSSKLAKESKQNLPLFVDSSSIKNNIELSKSWHTHTIRISFISWYDTLLTRKMSPLRNRICTKQILLSQSNLNFPSAIGTN